MRFAILGPVLMADAGRPVPVGSGRERFVLVTLLLNAGRVVRTDALVDALWAEPPPSAKAQLHNMISHLRRRTGAGADAVIRSRPGGYELRLDGHDLDLDRFRDLAARAREASDAADPTAARRHLADALALWRGRPLDDVPDELAAGLRSALAEERVAVVESYVDVLLAVHDDGDALRALAEVIGDHPYRDGLHHRWMLALVAAGRRVEALAHYREVYRRFSDDLGITPSPRLRDLEQRILRGDDPAAVPPAQLPPPVAGFTGRGPELDLLLARADASRAAAATGVRVVAIDGMPGVGKTTLAVHAARLLVDAFPDGQLFVDLHGHSNDLDPLDPHGAVEAVLRALGVGGSEVPPTLDARAALVRSRLAGRRVLLILDDAVDEAQVLPLLPGDPACLVLVTGRRRLTGLDSAVPLSLDVLGLAEATALFRAAAFPDPATAPSGTPVEEIVEECGRLPLALRIAAARLRHRPTWTVGHLAARLRDERSRLTELSSGSRSVRAAFRLSYRDLTPDVASAFVRLGAHPGPDFGPYAAAALIGTTVPAAVGVLEHLLDVHLLVQRRPDRYRFHDLVGLYVAEAGADGDAAELRAGVDRVLDHYVHTAAVATALLYPYESEPVPDGAATAVPDIRDRTRAARWVDEELPNLLAAARAAERDRPEHTTALSAILRRHLRVQGRHPEAEGLHGAAARTAARTGDAAGSHAALYGLASAVQMQGRYDEAIRHYDRALEVACGSGDRRGELRVRNGLGMVHYSRARYAEATASFTRAVGLAAEVDDDSGLQVAQYGLGMTHYQRGELGPAARHFERAGRLARDIGNPTGELAASYSLGNVHRRLGRRSAAASCYERVLVLARALGHRPGEGAALRGLADLAAADGRSSQAERYLDRALGIARDHHDRNAELEALLGLSGARLSGGDPGRALSTSRRALAVADTLAHPADQVRAHDVSARIRLALHRPADARRHWEDALRLLVERDLGTVHDLTAADLRARLAALEDA